MKHTGVIKIASTHTSDVCSWSKLTIQKKAVVSEKSHKRAAYAQFKKIFPE